MCPAPGPPCSVSSGGFAPEPTFFHQIVPPGMNLNPADAGWQPPALTDPAARRRPQAARAAG